MSLEEENIWKKRFERERALRKEAERLLESKSMELYQANLHLEDKINAEAVVSEELRQSNEELNAMVDIIHHQKEKLVHQHRDIQKSIDVAFVIQSSFLPAKAEISRCTDKYFILNLPRNVVSGDFYWIHRKENRSIFVVADCTGHGVPGAFMSLIGNALLNKIILDNNVFLPDHILFYLHQFLSDFFKKGDQNVREGMDVGVCVYNHETHVLKFAGAMTSLHYAANGEVVRVKGDRKSIGGRRFNDDKEYLFTAHSIELEPDMVFYLATDGYQDQFGGELDKRITPTRLRNLFLEGYKRGFDEQKERLETFFNAWKEGYNQIDDVLIVGFAF